MLTVGQSITFSFWEAGCLILVAAKDLIGLSYEEFCSLIWGENPQKLRDYIFEKKAFIPLDLYQDDGYRVRVTMGELTPQEQEEWVARCRWQLDLSCGQMIVTGCLGDVDEFLEMPNAIAMSEDSDELQCYVEVPPGLYQVEIYSFAPGDLSTGWGQIVNSSLFPPTAGTEPESLADYFYRTRPNTKPPAWIGLELTDNTEEQRELYAELDEMQYINFIIRLTLHLEDLSAPIIGEDGGVQWEFRKPDLCPLGILS
jgi:hypothetical protein